MKGRRRVEEATCLTAHSMARACWARKHCNTRRCGLRRWRDGNLPAVKACHLALVLGDKQASMFI